MLGLAPPQDPEFLSDHRFKDRLYAAAKLAEMEEKREPRRRAYAERMKVLQASSSPTACQVEVEMTLEPSPMVGPDSSTE